MDSNMKEEEEDLCYSTGPTEHLPTQLKVKL